MDIKELLKTPARVQVSRENLPSNIPPQTGLIFNIWYNKWSHGASSNNSQGFLNKYRCNPQKDSGYTQGSIKKFKNKDATNTVYFCLYFAKGLCCKGSKCEYLHYIPCKDMHLTTIAKDCFGRDKFSEYRDDMAGVGSFNKINKTLYIGGLSPQGTGLPNNTPPYILEAKLKQRFGEFGDLEYIRYLKEKNCCFIQYRYQSCAEFAKEAMSRQSLLDSDEEIVDGDISGIIVKWAKEDPNPHLKKNKMELEDEKIGKLMDDVHNEYVMRQPENNNEKQETNKRPLEYGEIFDKDTVKFFKQKMLHKKIYNNIHSMVSMYNSDNDD
ncbi:related to Pre-mRNA-splicing factor CWC2 [Saccharomycodes ludwigii]|uniref:Pre-mRNA-splicing factor CWC2 n=1 Tax=Saccharomycodes ludwigii TaxID=36035 RepID=A0A376BAQ7_9ASCO|nr:hypothetical protein SCDLUD_001936 [Saccharomycodes ludwigii]KAH3902123.1 hypothetical protein SCDLUD_001936 [Saccharomycodes ludwigii]SSD61742.1 related to Pre-mRNA-splicing factor CWC2 [Saccharomycodes ludwigii]